MRTTKEEIHALSFKHVEKLLSLAGYHRRAELLKIHLSNAVAAGNSIEDVEEKEEFHKEFVRHYKLLCFSYVYVVQEGIKSLEVKDEKLEHLVARESGQHLRKLKFFRHNTFHYSPRWYTAQHAAIVGNSKLALWVLILHRRHGVVIRRLMRFVASGPFAWHTIPVPEQPSRQVRRSPQKRA